MSFPYFLALFQSVALETMLKDDAPMLAVSQFQYEVKKDHYQGLYSLLQRDHKSAMPVLDPTQGTGNTESMVGLKLRPGSLMWVFRLFLFHGRLAKQTTLIS